jgi:hypothetical protein
MEISSPFRHTAAAEDLIRSDGRPRVLIPRTTEACERYLDRMALVLERAGANRAAFLPINRRLERELAEARAEEEILNRMKDRFARLTGP